MENKKFKLWNSLTAAFVFVVSAVTYLATIEPTASFWDCGEFIASSYRLEVGHPPGNPVFQLIARFFTLFGDNMHAAILVNCMSALCSALTIFLLYLTIVFFAKRLVRPGADGKYSVGAAVAIFGSGAVGALAYCFSDTFWFSAVEGEVYAMSSLFTALVFWAMTKWYEQADEAYANRWIVLICFLMGLSIGVHLLNLLAIPALVFLYYYKKREDGTYTFWEFVKIFLVGVVILALVLFGIIPWLPKLAAYFDLFFVNVLHLPFNSGAAFFLVAVLALCFWGLFKTFDKGKVFWNTFLMCLTTIVIGFSIFSIVIIRSSVKTPTNEYQPDNAFTLVRYLSREQYGSTPLVYGQYFDAPYKIEIPKYWAPLDGRYKKVDGPAEAKYDSEGMMFFPRMWYGTGQDPKTIDFYESYMDGKGKVIPGANHKKPTFGANMKFFFDFQLGWMYWRYFMWNFVGRQNEIHSPSQNLFTGNWESGIKFIDELRLDDQGNAPDVLKNNKGKNHYFFLPLLLGLLGLFFQFDKDKRGCWLVFLLFFMTGIAVVMYLNQPPYQVRERDYAYAGSFYAFSIWAGFAVAAIYTWLSDAFKAGEKGSLPLAAGVTLLCLCVPALMAAENWDDHDRSNRYTSIELATNYLNSVGPNGILITHGDNDTFPLWYAQEVENVRTDVRICNTSLLGTDWHIDQMKYAVNESAPLALTVPPELYLYGNNELIPIYDTKNQSYPLGEVMAVFKDPRMKLPLQSGRKVSVIASRKFWIPVDKDNVIKSGILDEKYRDQIPDRIELSIPENKDYITKPELFMLDLLANYKWDRPINMLNEGGDLDIGIKEYLEYQGFSYKFIPIRNKISVSDAGFIDTDRLYKLMTETYTWDALKREDYFVDHQNLYTFLGVISQRGMFVTCCEAFMKAGENERAVAMLDKCQEVVRDKNYPLESIPVGFTYNDYLVVEMVRDYYILGQKEKARNLATRFITEAIRNLGFDFEYYSYLKGDCETLCSLISVIASDAKEHGDAEFGGKVEKILDTFLEAL